MACCRIYRYTIWRRLIGNIIAPVILIQFADKLGIVIAHIGNRCFILQNIVNEFLQVVHVFFHVEQNLVKNLAFRRKCFFVNIVV